ncbi:DUF3617 domain-containing protein [Caulobacter mirabilis]|uniref:DUF3617 domain-containing protein n=1 Tax=Caulobacter mirabilis TaxID=69666 RepID=A0A2D2AT07_9CAUL|nr:DUF3617 family protein [Caulobacter mirabilis]ATQ41148.1 hypothetical protein CSW64_01340 [Caulobacter mirabilis]
MFKAGVITVALLAVAGCSENKAPAAKPEAKAPVEVPKRKPGLWKQTMLVEGVNVIQTVQLCIDPESDSKLAWWGQQGLRQSCSKNDLQRQPDGSWKFASVCEGVGVKTATTGSAVGDFSSRYQLKAEATTSGAPIPEMNGTRTVTIDASWVGECPQGMKPGDMEMPNGQRINMLQVSGQK